MSFHLFRPSFWPRPDILSRIWAYHDRNPLPPFLNVKMRYLMYLKRKVSTRVKSKKPSFIYGTDNSLSIAPRLNIVKPNTHFPLDKKMAEHRFEHVHKINEHLLCIDGAWTPHKLVDIYNSGISVEEIALRVRGYVSAYAAVNDSIYLERAKNGCKYLLDKRVFSDGHIHLLGHTVIDITYSFVGEAFLTMWKVDNSWDELLQSAKKIGDRLIEYHISGSVNHAIVPVQLLGQLYQITGEKKYLRKSIKIMFRTALPLQLPYGGWLGHESWVWYHALILRSLIIGYTSIPNTLEYYAKKDKIACTIIAAVNRLILSQNDDGSLPIRPPEPLCEYADDMRYRTQKVVFSDEGTIQKVEGASITYGFWNGYVIDALVTAYELLHIREIIPCLNKFANNIIHSDQVWRLEFDTLGAGRLLEYTHKIIHEKKDEELAQIV